MKNYTDYTDLDAADSDNPNGAIKDGATTGTLLNKVSWNDLFQTIWKAVRNTDITPSSDYDNVTNGYQMFKAFFGEDWKEVGNDGGATTFTASASTSTGNGSGNGIRYRRINGGTAVHIEGWMTITAEPTTAWTLPSGYRPSGNARITVITIAGGSGIWHIYADGTVQVSSTGTGSSYINTILPLD